MRARAAVVAVLLGSWPLQAAAVDVPARTSHFVNDYADILPPAEEQRLEAFLTELDRQTTNQIVVVTLPSLEGDTAENVTLKFAEAWKPGREDRDNGVVVGVFPNDRQARIEVGYGLEGAIPDAIAATILNNEMVPLFRRGDWAAGTEAGVRALAKAAAGEYSGPSRPAVRQVKIHPVVLFLLIFFGIGFWILFAVFGRRGYTAYGPGGYRRHRSYWGGPWGGGGFGGGRGGFGGFGGGGGGFGGGGATGRW